MDSFCGWGRYDLRCLWVNVQKQAAGWEDVFSSQPDFRDAKGFISSLNPKTSRQAALRSRRWILVNTSQRTSVSAIACAEAYGHGKRL